MCADYCHCETISGWDALLNYYYQHFADSEQGFGKGWAFRGEKKATDGLRTSLERVLDTFGHDPNNAADIEARTLADFKRRLHHYTSDVPHKRDVVEWLALMQHYGAPTRLLDWTYSFFIAVYFAVENASTEDKLCTVWAIRLERYEAESQFKDWEIKDITAECDKNLADDFSIRGKAWAWQNVAVEYVMRRPRPLVLSVNPFRLNERLSIQQGLFMLPGDLKVSFLDNLRSCGGSPSELQKLEIVSSVEVRKTILLNLYRMNISQATLFPGLEGYAKSLRTKIAFPELLTRPDMS